MKIAVLIEAEMTLKRHFFSSERWVVRLAIILESRLSRLTQISKEKYERKRECRGKTRDLDERNLGEKWPQKTLERR